MNPYMTDDRMIYACVYFNIYIIVPYKKSFKIQVHLSHVHPTFLLSDSVV